MAHDIETKRCKLLTLHYVVRSLAMSLASGFVGAYLLRLGFSLATAIAIYAVLYLTRFAIRFGAAAVIRRLGVRRSLLVGASLGGLQFLPLVFAERPTWLAIWVLTVCVGDCVYFPVYHAASAVCGGNGRRGRQIAERLFSGTAISIIGPLAGGVLLADAGAAAGFGVASLVCLNPLLWLGDIDVGWLPSLREAARLVDRVGILTLVADGWVSAGTSIAWSMILFTSLGSSFGAFGTANALAAVVGALVGLLCGQRIDHGQSQRLLRVVTAGLLAGIALRAGVYWDVQLAPVANAAGAAITGLYSLLLMSAVYDRAKHTGEAYHFHLCAEAGLDVGMIFGCMTVATLVWLGVEPPLAITPAALGVLLVFGCLRTGRRAGAGVALRHLKAGLLHARLSRAAV
jgi:MFS transporter, DHA1 family, inner membrane transport protein